jgi:hypothetical protein
VAKKPQRKGGARSSRSPFDDTQKVPAGALLGEDCPVRALGHISSTYYFSDPVGQVRTVRAGEMTPNGLISLFLGDIAWLEENCPTGSKREVKGTDRSTWHNPSAVQRLVAACRREGFFDPIKQTRGPGIWPYNAELLLGDDVDCGDQMVIHVGDRVGLIFYNDGGLHIDWESPGCKIGEFVYPAAPTVAMPADESASDEELEQLVAFFHRWNWRDGEAAPWLGFGHACICMIPGVVRYRPGAWVQGGSGMGKSTYLSFIEYLLQGRALKYDNTTAARLRDDFRESNQARPVIINEAEAQEDNTQVARLVEMSRLVYDAGGGDYGRGGSQGAASTINAIFLFAAIEPPPLLPQDANRIAMLRLGPLETSAEAIEEFEHEMPAIAKAIAPKLLRRMIEVWPMLPEALAAFRKVLRVRGHTVRMANTFGMLLSAAHLARYGAVPDDSDVDEWAKKLDAKLLANRDDHRSSEGLCLMHLLTFRIGPYRSGDLKPLGDYVRLALYAHPDDARDPRQVIKRYGLAVVDLTPKDGGRAEKWLAVSNRHQGLQEIFRGTHWAKGAHVETLRLLKDARPSPRPIWFGGAQDRATLVPIDYVPQNPIAFDRDELEEIADVE